MEVTTIHPVRAHVRARRLAGALAALVAALCVSMGLWLGAPAADAAPQAGKSVVGGRSTTTAEWPYQVALLRRDRPVGDLEREFCGGEVLTPTLILTAAHCIVK